MSFGDVWGQIPYSKPTYLYNVRSELARIVFSRSALSSGKFLGLSVVSPLGTSRWVFVTSGTRGAKTSQIFIFSFLLKILLQYSNTTQIEVYIGTSSSSFHPHLICIFTYGWWKSKISSLIFSKNRFNRLKGGLSKINISHVNND